MEQEIYVSDYVPKDTENKGRHRGPGPYVRKLFINNLPRGQSLRLDVFMNI